MEIHSKEKSNSTKRSTEGNEDDRSKRSKMEESNRGDYEINEGLGDPKVDERGYEYLDHTADIQLHSWAKELKEAFELVGICMFGYMTDLDTISTEEEHEFVIESEGDLDQLLFAFLDELLFHFSTELLVCKEIQITEFDVKAGKITAIGKGETFDREKHPQGTEVKAITYSNMQIHEKEGRSDVYVIVDI
eukprot:TRINITY_DN1477_c0_g1_i1.p1 TRINITY_DN1477_c0_g1~~TRINITY_DN1477_c0_g1_i1.p1  ORF type:complete len:191 (+),score=78.15 TRINITY_DN1477_c0_g1_i1:79-651(+)